MTYQQRDIVMLPVSYTNQYEREYRPAIIISNDLVNGTQDCLVIPLTSTLRNNELSFPILTSDVSVPLPFLSEARFQKIIGVEKRLIKKKISTLNLECFERLITAFQKVIAPQT
jgi:mRNA-degrading endonuclease toxin of MazEF toxin-antitoxin module